ncbi:alpha-L-fucosidase [Pedobacter sp. PLR]|uniref:alpha-L-fucosidase n=1 Tax=Pedobacter sp. PLR TaxID=2994465 RepID=UPI00224665CB|nr:alpha-L-fucosidase [Pedobacter sp. PLR]MCX2452654.1 alpha-L-fucosidase [Pedobacter sp. PLR]
MTTKQKSGFLLLLLLLCSSVSFSQHDPKALKAWQDQKYSMFIHYGIYSVLGGVWEGKEISKGLSEQIQAHAGIYSDTYAGVAKRFNPKDWNADSIVSLAKKAGMRSIVITSKHHDGFCMFKTATTDFNVVDATPFKRDIVKELSEACKRAGLRFGLYFSLIDWHYPQASPISSSNSDYITPEHVQYNKKQITELLSNYGPISELWFDMGSQNASESKELRDLVHKLQPDCMIGSRIGNDMGDFNVMGDNQEPDYAIGVPWQSPASFFDDTWSYRSWQDRGSEALKTKEKLTSLIRVVSRGGNFLLNIGPKGEGSVVGFEKDILLNIGKWLDKNGEAIYGTDADPFHVAFKWGSLTAKPNKLYLHVMSNPENGQIILPGLKGKIKSIGVLGEKYQKISFTQNDQGVKIKIPSGINPDQEFKVIRLTFANGYTVPPANVIPLSDAAHNLLAGGLNLNSQNAFKHYSSSGVDYNTRFQSTIKESWTLQPLQNGNYTPVIYYSAQEKGKTIDLELNGKVSPLTFTDGKTEAIKQNGNLTWGPIYLSDALETGIEGFPGDPKNIDPTQPWAGKRKALNWTKKTGWKNNEKYTLEADPSTAVYLLQEINATEDQPFLVGITSTDGVLITLNGLELAKHNNPFKENQSNELILLPLKKGKNQLLVKLYNGYQKKIDLGIDNSQTQELYYKNLPDISFEKGRYYPFSWQLNKPLSPHSTLRLSNVTLLFSGK